MAKQSKVEDDYEFGEELGQGAFSVVYLGKKKSTGEQVAIKVLDKTRITAKDYECMKDEIGILPQLNHPNIIKFYEYFETSSKLFIITELCSGGDLFDRLAQREFYTEVDAQKILRTLASVLEYCHKKKIVHRDLKPENILILTPDEDSPIKVADFGFATILDSEGYANTLLGTLRYCAPEVLLKKRYDAAVDCWTFGVIMYTLLVGYPPFHSENPNELYHKIIHAEYKFDPEFWGNVSDSAKDLIEKLLVLDPAKRLTVDGILSHPWISDTVEAKDITPALNELRSFVNRRRLKRSVGAVVALSKMKSLMGKT